MECNNREEYAELLAAKAQLMCLQRLFESELYASPDTIRAMMGWGKPEIKREVVVPDVFDSAEKEDA